MVAQAHPPLDRVPVWSRVGFAVAAVVAMVGDGFFVHASAGAGTSVGWAAFFAAYLSLAAAAALVAAAGRGSVRAACGGGAAGAAVAFNFLALLSVGIFFLPLTIWVVAAALQAGRQTSRARLLVLAAGGAALAAPILGLAVLPP